MALALLLAACGPAQTPAEKAAADARAVAQVEAIQKQKPPARRIVPQPIAFDDIARNELFGPGCAFAPGGGLAPVLLAQGEAGYMKLGGRMARFAADPGSARLPLGAWSRYVGKEHALSLTRVTGEGEADRAEAVRWTGHLTVTDPFDQVVYAAEGTVQCGS